MTIQEKITQGKTFLGIEFGSTRIKASLIDDARAPVASGSHAWENRLENGYWTYSTEDILGGMRACYADLKRDVSKRYGVTLENLGAVGISAMMHGYMPFDSEGTLLAPFRTWRNTTTERAARELTELFGFNIPQRWSVAHLWQAVLDEEPHVRRLSHIATLAGHIHFLLTGERAVGIGEASGMFPVSGGGYDAEMLGRLDKALAGRGAGFKAADVLPRVMTAGERCGTLTEEGVRLLDPEGDLKAGAPFCPPEGDAGTGMVATNAVLPKKGNISAGTSIFSMLVLEKPLEGVYPEIDVVATPDGAPVAMVHCNNCCSELDAWVSVFGEFSELLGLNADKSELYERLYKKALSGEGGCGGVVAYNCLSGEPVIGVAEGRPMYFRAPDSRLTLANFMRAQLYSAFAALSFGMDILFKREKVSAGQFTGHGGLFKVEGVAQQLLSDALNTPVSVMKTAGEGGAWGMALLAAYSVQGNGKPLAEWLDSEVFADMEKRTVLPDERGARGFTEYMERYLAGLKAERSLGSGETEGM